MKRLPCSLLFVLLVFTTDLMAQQITPRVLPARVEDAIRFGNVDPLGTARFMGTGGSMTAIGVDVTTLHTNPAGIGWNRYSAAQITPGFVTAPVNTMVLSKSPNDEVSESSPTFNLPSLGFVYTQQTRSVNWSTFNLGVNLTRTADFNETIAFDGYSEGSVIDGIVEDLNDGVQDPFRSGLIFDIDDAIQRDNQGFFSDFDVEENIGGETRKTGTVSRSGGITELALGAGGNYKEKVLWGVTLGIPFVSFTEERRYDEIDDRDEITFFDDAGFDETLEMSGSGVNFKLGLIYLPTPQVRLSAAVHSPTLWTIDETYFTTLEYNFTDGGVAQGGTALSPESVAAVNLQTPFRFLFGGGYIIGNKGFVSFDLDYANYASSTFGFDDFASTDEAAGQDIDASLGGSLGVKLGGELNLKPFQVRVGAGYRTIPNLDVRNDEDSGTVHGAFGAGWSKGKLFIDAALRAEAYNGFYAPYRTFAFDGTVVTTERTRLTALLTVGFRGW